MVTAAHARDRRGVRELRSLFDPRAEFSHVVPGQRRSFRRHLELGIHSGDEDEQSALRGFLANLNDRTGVAARERGFGFVEPQAPFGFVSAVTFPTRALK